MMAEPETVIEVRSTTSSRPQEVAAVVLPVQVLAPGAGGGGVPATYKVVPLRRPMVAPCTGRGVVPEVLVFMSSTVMLAGVPASPPHSGPQFRMYAVVSSLLKIPQTGWSKTLFTGFGLHNVTSGSGVPSGHTKVRGSWLVPIKLGAMTVTTSELSPNAKIRLPLWLCTIKCAPGTGSVAEMAPAERFSTSTAPGVGGCPVTGALGTAA